MQGHNKSDLKLELFLTDSFQKTTQIRVYCPNCLHWSYALHNIIPESTMLTVNTQKQKTYTKNWLNMGQYLNF